MRECCDLLRARHLCFCVLCERITRVDVTLFIYKLYRTLRIPGLCFYGCKQVAYHQDLKFCTRKVRTFKKNAVFLDGDGGTTFLRNVVSYKSHTS
jgi:hypothetical protein